MTADEPAVVHIRPRTGWSGPGLRELWAYRELAYFLVWRDLKVRYKQTAFGALWAVIQPVGLMLVFSLFLGRIGGLAPSGLPYPLFVLAGLVPWTMFSQSLMGSSNSLVGATTLIQKVFFPRLLLPISAIGSFVVDFLIAFGVLMVITVASGFVPGPTVVWIVPFVGLALTTSLAAGVWLAAINVRYRDVRHALPFLVQLWLFASPVAYSIDLVPSAWRPIYQLNPMAGVIEGFRWALFGGEAMPIGPILLSFAGSLLVLALGVAYFRRVERTFADVI